jgi:hypothetical protein
MLSRMGAALLNVAEAEAVGCCLVLLCMTGWKRGARVGVVGCSSGWVEQGLLLLLLPAAPATGGVPVCRRPQTDKSRCCCCC